MPLGIGDIVSYNRGYTGVSAAIVTGPILRFDRNPGGVRGELAVVSFDGDFGVRVVHVSTLKFVCRAPKRRSLTWP